LVWETFTGYQRTAALKAAIELDLFGQIAPARRRLTSWRRVVTRRRAASARS
jgi:hypothetical protein